MTIAVEVPGSKSMTQRALIIGSLAERPVTIVGALDGDDSRALVEVLRSLGVNVGWEGNRVHLVPAPLRSSGGRLDCGNGGTTIRFSAGLSLVCEGPLFLDGDARMRERTIRSLGLALSAMGVEVQYPSRSGYPPVRLLRTKNPPREVAIDGSQSSQFISSLLLVAPRLPDGLRLSLDGLPVSRPYLEMTMGLMSAAGASVRWAGDRSIAVDAGNYYREDSLPEISIEPDWSAAAFFLAAGVLLDTDVVIRNLVPPERSVQGDAAFGWFVDELRQDRRHEFDLTDVPDLIAPLSAAALFASESTEIRGAAHTRIKESDRISVLSTELRKLGAKIEEKEDGMIIHPLKSDPTSEAVQLDPSDDHRMAMAFGVISLRLPAIEVLNPGCVSKSFPDFWEVLSSIRPATSRFGKAGR
ncbi:MAG: 3-phosphoshikimate 1-carboxyvinyltransferase [Acidobacteriota bacterium]